MSESESKRPKDNDFYQQRLKYWQPLYTPKNVIICFSVIGILFVLIGIPICVSSNQLVDYRINYHGASSSLDDCKISANNEHRECTVKFVIDREMKAPVHMYYELKGFYQNHRLYVNSRDDAQLRGEEVDLETLTANCGNKTMDGDKILNPCGSVANSFFNDVFTFVPSDSQTNLYLDESGIAWKYDLDKFNNPSNYGDTKYKWLYETYPEIIPKDKSDDPRSASFNGGGVRNEHFIVWMRAAALPRFRKLYGRFKTDIPAGTELEFKITNNFYVDDLEKTLILTTTNWLGGRNYFLGWGYIGVGVFCILFAIAFIIKQLTCPRKLGDTKYLKLD